MHSNDYITEAVNFNSYLRSIAQLKTAPNLHPVGFEPTRFGETVGLKSTPLDHSGKDANCVRTADMRWEYNIYLIVTPLSYTESM